MRIQTLCKVLATSAAMALPALGSAAAPEPPLECPHCGTWTIIRSSPPGFIGETMVVNDQWLKIPTCGEVVGAKRVSMSVMASAQNPADRSYRGALSLDPDEAGFCKTELQPPGRLRLDVEVEAGHRADGARANFSLVDTATGAVVFSAAAQNYERENPCDTGSSQGTAACMVVAHAQLVRQLAQSAIAARPDFRLGRVVQAAQRACVDHGRDAGGSWPFVWQLSCQTEVLEKKLQEFNVFHACRAAQRGRCRLPAEKLATPSEGPIRDHD